MEFKTLNDKEINPNHWYLLSLKKGIPRLSPRRFLTEKDLKNFMRINKIKGIHFITIRGSKALEYGLTFYTGLTHSLLRKGDKHYDYPVDRTTSQDMKSFRTKSRRWKRDFGKLPTNLTDFKNPANGVHTKN